MEYIGFFLTYLVIPLIISCYYIYGALKDDNLSMMKFHYYKGIFCVYSIILTILQIFKVDYSISRYVVGLALALGTMEAVSSIVDGIKAGKMGN